MKKVFIAAREADHDRLFEALGRLGVVHILPVDADRAVADEQALTEIDATARAMQILPQIPSADGAPPDMRPADVVDETLRLEHESSEGRSRLQLLYKQVHDLAVWGDVRLEELEALTEAGVTVTFAVVPTKDIAAIRTEMVLPIAKRPQGTQLVAAISREAHAAPPELPDSATVEPLPTRDRPTVLAEAAQLDERLKEVQERLAELAPAVPALAAYHEQLQAAAEEAVASRSALTGNDLTAFVGWAPDDRARHLHHDLEAQNVEAAVETVHVADDEIPPTLIRYPRLVRPIKGLFDIMGTVAGYREFDVSIAFMLALPIFAAMLIGDAGYGALILLALAVSYRKAAPAMGREFAQLMMIVGATTTVWGLLSGNVFGFTVFEHPLIPVNMSDESRRLIMRISFFMGAIHLSIAQLWQAARFFPNARFLGRLGWAIFIWGMLGVVQWLVMGKEIWSHDSPYPYMLGVGVVLAFLFAYPYKNVLKRFGFGLADLPLSVISAFSDVTSYVRLMAVGLASSVLASNFNEMALDIGIWPLTAMVFVLGHGLNIALCLIALFAHGVRLNMLEFSNSLGMQWTGYAYQPFVRHQTQEITV